MSYWTAARLHPHRENLALNLLAMRGFKTYQPRIQERRTIRGRKTLVTSALFPGYTFLVIELQWNDARYCPGVAALLMDGLVPAHVPDREIAALLAQEHDGYIVLPDAPPLSPKLRIGSRVRIRNGPLIGFTGLCAGMSGRERIKVLLQIFGSSRQVAVSTATSRWLDPTLAVKGTRLRDWSARPFAFPQSRTPNSPAANAHRRASLPLPQQFLGKREC